MRRRTLYIKFHHCSYEYLIHIVTNIQHEQDFNPHLYDAVHFELIIIASSHNSL